jgi:Protein of unknown function (DUF664)
MTQTTFSADDRVDPPLHADEATMLRAFLDYHRDTFRWKCSGLTQRQLAQPLPPSEMTLGGMMKHLAVVESGWFEESFTGRALMPPFDAVDWEADRDWEWRTAADDTPEELFALFADACGRADAVLDAAMAGSGLDSESAQRDRHSGTPFSLRWIVLHMIEEYARHNGHADLIRQSIDGETGE